MRKQECRKTDFYICKSFVRQFQYDLVVLGIGCTKTSFNLTEGIKTEYVDPASLVYSYTEDPNFEDLYYVGEVKTVSLPELKKQFPQLTPEDLKQINKVGSSGNYLRGYNGGQGDDDQVNVLFFEYKTYSDRTGFISLNEEGL